VKVVQEVPEIYYGGKDLMKREDLSLKWQSEGVMDAESGDDDKDDLTCEWRGESRQD